MKVQGPGPAPVLCEAAAWTWSPHAVQREIDRQVPEDQILRALADPDAILAMPEDRSLYRRGVIDVVVNTRDHVILSCWYRWRGRGWSR